MIDESEGVCQVGKQICRKDSRKHVVAVGGPGFDVPAARGVGRRDLRGGGDGVVGCARPHPVRSVIHTYTYTWTLSPSMRSHL